MRGMGMRTAPTRQVAFAAMFGLTDEQKKQMKRVLDDEYKNAEPLRKELETSRETIGLAIRDEQSAPVVDQAVSEYSVPVAAMAAAELSTGSCSLNGSAGLSRQPSILARPGAPASQYGTPSAAATSR